MNQHLKKGDVVTVLATVKHDVRPGDEIAHVVPNGSYATACVPRESVTSIHSRNLKPGDEVSDANIPGTFVVVATDGCDCWVRMKDKPHQQFLFLSRDLVPASG